jgi:uncharacterized protein YbbK (DUF523 family)/uncharacterized protein YbgA (DUF1722 family)
MTSHPSGRPHRRIRLGISACLLGDEVRYDGGHKRDPFLTKALGPLVEWVKVCPEVEVGMGTPREPIRLVDEGGVIRLRAVKSAVDHTASMTAYAAKKASALAGEDLCGFVLKKDSPSCGMTRVKVYRESGPGERRGVGLFARALLERFPDLPIEDEGRLHDPALRDNFLERIFAYRRLADLFQPRWTIGELVAFHTAHKLTLLAHSTVAYARLGRLVADAKSVDRTTLRERYTAGFMAALAALATARRHTNVLQHMAGYFKKSLDEDSHAELHAAIEDFRLGRVSRDVPLTLLRHHARVQKVNYLTGQRYLSPDA